ncbi:hypothetical protein Pla100_26320 [Neorhodopirellula pilleata]|uniref:Uncharacterized protein n=1 Tax=Neorhodopirellula pilleata TaxID=2714738 RepID=A0A5C6ADU2_9BACT|nr:hypothetical protein Pla100_26320 [Neorhodopirellula pilleata]
MSTPRVAEDRGEGGFGMVGWGLKWISGSPLANSFPGGAFFYPTHLFDPHELVSWVNKVCKLDTDVPTFRVQLVLAASSGEHKLNSEGWGNCGLCLACQPRLPARRAGRGAIHEMWPIKRAGAWEQEHQCMGVFTGPANLGAGENLLEGLK